MKILSIFRFFHFIWSTDCENLFYSYFENLFYSYFERTNDKVLTFNIVHFLNFEISTKKNTERKISFGSKFTTH